MSGTYTYTDRNGFPQAPEISAIYTNLNGYPYGYQVQYVPHTHQSTFPQQIYQQPAHVPPQSSDYYNFTQPMVATGQMTNPPPQLAVPITHNKPPKKSGGLIIKDVLTHEELDLKDVSKYFVSSTPRNNEASSTPESAKTHGPLRVETPPPKEQISPPTCIVESGTNTPLAESDADVDIKPGSPKGKIDLQGESSKSSDKDSDIEDDRDLNIEIESVEIINSSDDEHRSSSTESVDLENTARVRKYDRDQLIAIRSVTDIKSLQLHIASPVMPVVDNSRKPRRDHRQPNKRILNFGTSDVKLDDVENAYKPSHLKQNDDKKDELIDRTTQLTKELNVLLNRTLEDNIAEIVEEVRKLSLKDTQEIACLVNVLTTKATRQPKYSDVFAKLCLKLSTVKQLDGFKSQLLKAVHELFKTPLKTHIDLLNAQIDSKIQSTTDEKVKKMLEEDRETSISKKKEAFLGIMQFFSHLYIHKIIPEKSVADALRPFAKPKTQDEILALLSCLNTCGHIMDQRGLGVFKDCIEGVKAARTDVKMEQYVLYKITALIELKESGWAKNDVITPNILPRSNSSCVNLAKRVHNHIGNQHARINTSNLAVTNQGNRGYLGPPTSSWTKGAQVQTPKTEAVNDSENGKESRASSVSGGHISAKVDKNMKASDAIRDAIDAFNNAENPNFELALPDKEKNAFVKDLISRAIEGKKETRNIIVRILTWVYKSQQVSDAQMDFGFNENACMIDEFDCPKFGDFFGELMSSLVTPSIASLDRIYRLLEPLPDDKEKCGGLACCLKTASLNIGEQVVAGIYQKAVLSPCPWGLDSSFADAQFVKRYHLEFLKEVPPTMAEPQQQSQQQLDIYEKIKQHIRNRRYDDLVSLCAELKKAPEMETSLKVIFACMEKPSRISAEALTPAVKILAEGFSGFKLIFCIEAHTEPSVFKLWLQTLVQKKVIAASTIREYANSLMSKTSHKEIAKQLLQNCRF